jgi:glycosyltransferase involved in cell wall biosynthesis
MTFGDRNRAGSGVYARSLLRALADRDDVEIAVVAAPRSGLPATVDWLVRGGARNVASVAPSLLHCPAVVAPWNLRLPFVVTIHDHSSTLFPDDHPLEWRLYERFCLPGRARAARRVLTGTEFAKRQLVEGLGLDPGRVLVTPYGVDPAFREAGRARHAPVDTGKPAPILFPGAPTARKNLPVLLQAMALAEPGGSLAAARLEISGALADEFPSHAALIRQLGLEDRVRWLGQVPSTDLAELVAAASAVVYPSRYEGFGLPAIEAMAAGTPLVTSNAACLPEVVGDGGLLVDPDDAAGLRDALEAVLGDADMRARLSAAGRRRAAAFTWERCADLTVEAYRSALGS